MSLAVHLPVSSLHHLTCYSWSVRFLSSDFMEFHRFVARSPFFHKSPSLLGQQIYGNYSHNHQRRCLWESAICTRDTEGAYSLNWCDSAAVLPDNEGIRPYFWSLAVSSQHQYAGLPHDFGACLGMEVSHALEMIKRLTTSAAVVIARASCSRQRWPAPFKLLRSAELSSLATFHLRRVARAPCLRGLLSLPSIANVMCWWSLPVRSYITLQLWILVAAAAGAEVMSMIVPRQPLRLNKPLLRWGLWGQAPTPSGPRPYLCYMISSSPIPPPWRWSPLLSRLVPRTLSARAGLAQESFCEGYPRGLSPR